MLKSNVETEAVASKVEQTTSENPETTQEVLEAHEKLTNEVKAEEVANAQKYDQILEEVKMNPEQDLAAVNGKIAELKKSVDENSKEYHDLFTTYSYDTPGINSSFKNNSIEKMAKENKYPNIDKIVAVIQKAREAGRPTKSDEKADNIWGKVFGVKKKIPAEMSAGAAQAIENALTSGTPGLNASNKSWENVVEFLSKNAPEMLKTQRYQNIINQLGRANAEFMESHKELLVKPEEIIDQPTCVRDSVGTVNQEKLNVIKELESKKIDLESKMNQAA